MAAITYAQTDTTATYNAGCSGATDGATTLARIATGSTPGSGTAQVAPGIGNSDALRGCFDWDCTAAPGVATWAQGFYTVPVNITACDADTILREVYICDFDGTSTYVEVTSTTSPGHTRGATGVVNVSVERTAGQGDYTPQSEANSRVFVVLVFSNNQPHGGSSVTITNNQTITTPIDDGLVPSLAFPRKDMRIIPLI